MRAGSIGYWVAGWAFWGALVLGLDERAGAEMPAPKVRATGAAAPRPARIVLPSRLIAPAAAGQLGGFGQGGFGQGGFNQGGFGQGGFNQGGFNQGGLGGQGGFGNGEFGNGAFGGIQGTGVLDPPTGMFLLGRTIMTLTGDRASWDAGSFGPGVQYGGGLRGGSGPGFRALPARR